MKNAKAISVLIIVATSTFILGNLVAKSVELRGRYNSGANSFSIEGNEPIEVLTRPKAIKWEYKIVSLSDINNSSYAEIKMESALETAGRQGWELVTASSDYLIFKRPD